MLSRHTVLIQTVFRQSRPPSRKGPDLCGFRISANCEPEPTPLAWGNLLEFMMQSIRRSHDDH